MAKKANGFNGIGLARGKFFHIRMGGFLTLFGLIKPRKQARLCPQVFRKKGLGFYFILGQITSFNEPGFWGKAAVKKKGLAPRGKKPIPIFSLFGSFQGLALFLLRNGTGGLGEFPNSGGITGGFS